MTPELAAAIATLRARCNDDIRRANSISREELARNGGRLPPIPFDRFNQTLKLCDAVFRAAEKEGSTP